MEAIWNILWEVTFSLYASSHMNCIHYQVCIFQQNLFYALLSSFVYPTKMLFVLQSTLEVLWENPVILAQHEGSHTHTFIYESLEFRWKPWEQIMSRCCFIHGVSSVFMSSQVCLFIYGEEAAAEVQKRALGVLFLALSISISLCSWEGAAGEKESEQRAEEREEPH